MAVGAFMGGVALIVALFFAASGRDVARSKGLGAPSSVVGAEAPAQTATAAKMWDGPPSLSKAGKKGKHTRVANAVRRQDERVWTHEELAQHDGKDGGSTLLLSILGEVYDVGPGARFYGPNGGYSHMAGCDNSRAFTSIEEDEDSENDVATKRCDSKILDLKRDNIEDILNWRDFYREHKEYRFVGVLHDRYYGADGSPTPDGQALEEVRSVGKQAQELEQQFNKRFMSCNMKHESAKTYVELWCSDGYHPKGSKPVHFYYRLPQKEEKGRCACLTAEARSAAVEEVAMQAEKPHPGMAIYRFVEYSDCEKQGQMCRRPKEAKPPL